MDQAIAKRLHLGRELHDRHVNLPNHLIRESDDLARLRSDFNTWDEYNEQLLASRFSTPKVANGYRRVLVGMGGYDDPQREREWVKKEIGPKSENWNLFAAS